VKTTIFMKDLNHFAEVNKLYAAYFDGVKVMPARSTVQVAKLPLDVPVEMEFVATF
jgi:2-iminobutanoate/2-iminopropanoate deaminase